MRKLLLAKNTAASLIAQITTLICGFILPRLFLQHYGSEVNGLVNSISQFLSVIAFLELGVGAVVQSSLYKPLAEKDNQQISKVMVSANKFFQRLARILLVYVISLMIIYPYIANQNFGFIYTATLIAAISISSFAQYYFGIVNSLLLNADQRGYIQYNAQTVTIILNTIVCAIMISMNGTIQVVKLVTSIIYLARPIILQIYVNNHYKINWKIKYTQEPIKQKWNGVAQHVASVVLDGTDTIVLTVFSTLSNVSIYSVYFLVVKGVKTLFLSVTNGIQALIGELWAKQELDQLKSFFGWIEWLIHTGTTYVFSCTAALIVPFIQVYTLGIRDANYIQPTFAVLLTLANAMHCLRLPYNIMVLAAGHYKQTQRNYIVAAILNIVVSVLTVKIWGLIGVAIGTLVAMTYQTIWLAIYDSRHFIYWPLKKVIRQFLVDIISSFLIISFGSHIVLKDITYFNWFFMAIKVAIVALFVAFCLNSLFYRSKMHRLMLKFRK
ncbi:MAG: polysaccharide biosynthesis C-terminal domain-containing protein [Holdemanella biformis]|uniref:polysaccharide biosynthesis C-terminal domain-containing protein n=1 Tax=Holdemanella biformis TaxID=1735 RepID=UPI0024315BFF|nr:polysaccharide biosynthesis C-terminal domain-containing protein [Holdemanella biformis]MBS6455310.1 polysaccharide biosynthesis C-terminal domain-containing protein [Holdemanella biformis]